MRSGVEGQSVRAQEPNRDTKYLQSRYKAFIPSLRFHTNKAVNLALELVTHPLDCLLDCLLGSCSTPLERQAESQRFLRVSQISQKCHSAVLQSNAAHAFVAATGAQAVALAARLGDAGWPKLRPRVL